MKSSRDPRLDAYISAAAEFAQPILRHLRALVHEACPEVVESIKWGMPAFGHAGRNLCHLAAFKAHCAFGFWHQGMEKVLAVDTANAETAMGHFGRITRLTDLPDRQTLLRYIRQAATLNESDVPSRPPKRPVRELPVPADLAAALKRNNAAARTFTAFSPSHRREYIEWIVDAKRDETRQKRLATALEWLAKGKSRNWKYQKC